MQVEEKTDFDNNLLELKKRLYNPQAALVARQIAEANDRPFDSKAHKEFIANHPLFSKFHLLDENDD